MILVIAALAVTAVPASAELQNVTVGGSIQIRGNWLDSAAGADGQFSSNQLFEPWYTLSSRPAVNPLAGSRWFGQPGRFPVFSPLSLDDDGHDNTFYNQRTRLNVRADFTDSVSAFIEFDVYHIWSEDFRSNYTTGVDARGAAEVELYQSYIEANDMFGAPLRMRVGRQEIVLGNSWLMGANANGPAFVGLSWDGIRATYATDLFSIDAFTAKRSENSPIEQDGDIDVYGVYGSYLGIENMTLDAYWLLVRDARSIADTYNGFVGEWLEDVISVDDYDATNLHTVGLRGAGTVGAFDIEAEVAYQFGDADYISWAWFSPVGIASPYGDDDAEFDAWGANVELGYKFDMAWQPELSLFGAYLDGEDNRDLTFIEWLRVNFGPFYRHEASLSFNRLFSDKVYSLFLDANRNLSNVWLAGLGVSAMPTESVKLSLTGTYFETIEPYDVTWPVFKIFPNWIGSRGWTPLAGFSFLDQENDDDLGWEVAATANYAYSEDLSFELGYAHFFTGDGLEQGSFNLMNGLGFDGGKDDDDMDYIYLETKLAF